MNKEKTMRNKIMIIGALSGAALMLASCGGTLPPVGGTPPGTVGGLPASLSDTTIAQIQDGAAKACGFVPTVQTIQGIAASFFTGGVLINSIVSGIENAICSAVKPKAAMVHGRRMLTGRPMVGNVPVEGYFLR